MKNEPSYGFFAHWPENGDDWLHPDDVAAARRMIPGERVFRREGQSGKYRLLHYGEIVLRAAPALWQEVAWEGFNIGDWVEVRSHGGRQRPHTGVIREMLWDAHSGAICYQISERNQPLPNRYSVDDLIAIAPCPDEPA